MKWWGKKNAAGGCAARRRAAAVVEMAVVTPLLLTILFGIIEYGYVFMVRQTVVNAAREGAREAVLQTSTDQDVRDRVEIMMQSLGLAIDADYTVTITHATDDDPTETVQVSVPYERVSLLGNYFTSSPGPVESIASMRKEG